MSGPVDVLEWMRQCAPDEVLAAVAELIDAIRAFRSDQSTAALQRLSAALARVQGGAA